MSNSIVFIHGAWLTKRSWENFTPYFEQQGYTCLTPEWPYRDASVEELRAHTPPELAEIGVTELTDHFAAIIKAMPESPILVGHSTGGLVVQQLLDRGLGSAGVGIDAVAPEGVLPLDWNVLKANSRVLSTWMGWDKVLTMSFEEFQFAFTNTFPEAQQRTYYERYIVPESGRIFFQVAFAALDPHHATRVNFKNNDRAPLLLIAGAIDHLVPAHVVKTNYEHHKQSAARTDFHEFPGRAHFLTAQEGWEEVAADIANWLDELRSQSTR
jgi:pimeloyl-ACP methyl ester carboxylesterase